MKFFEIKEDYESFESGPGVRNAEAMDMLSERSLSRFFNLLNLDQPFKPS